MKKALLRKCKHCNFKRRSCMLDRLSCPALQKTCFACKKDGHFPKSINCKKSRMDKRSRTPIITVEHRIQNSVTIGQISAKVQKLIIEKIKWLEEDILQETSELSDTSSTQDSRYTDLIPFLMMYIFLNYDCIFALKYGRKGTSLLKEAKKESDVKKAMLKSAMACASKFDNLTDQQKPYHFSK